MASHVERSKSFQNGIEEHRWHYASDNLSFMGKLKMHLSVAYGSHLLFHAVLYAAPLYIPFLAGYISTKTFIICVVLYFSSFLIFRPFECRNGQLPWYPKWFKHHVLWEYMKFYGDWLIIRRGADSLFENKQFLYGS